MSRKNTPSKTPTREGKNGGKLKTGNPGNKGGTGRPRDQWKAELAAMASSDAVMEHIKSVLEIGPTHPFFPKALDFASERGFGKEATPVEQSGSLDLNVVIREE